MDAEQAREGVGLGVAERRELLGDVLDRAVALAELHPGKTTCAHRAGGRGEPVPGQGRDEGVGAGRGVAAGGGEPRGIPGLEVGHPLAGEVGDGVGSDRALEVAQGVHGELVVVGRQRLVARIGDDEGPGRATAAPMGRAAGVVLDDRVLDDRVLLGEGVEVAADRCRRQAQERAHLGCGDRSVLGDDRHHPLTGAVLEVLRGGLAVR